MQAIFTCDDAGASTAPRALEAFDAVVDWLGSVGLEGTFFWVPKPGEHPEVHYETWAAHLDAALAAGHEFQLHGLTHGTCLEFGLTQESTRPSNPAPFEDYEARPDYFRREHSVENLTAKLREARDIYECAFHAPPLVFRAPCFGMCANAYAALHAVGIYHSSSRGLDPTATAYTITKDPSKRRWAPDYPCHPWVEPPGVTEYVCFEDLTLSGVPSEEYDDRLDLYKSELEHFLAEATQKTVLVFGTHFSAMYATWENTCRLLEELFDWLSGCGVTEWLTFADHVSP